MPSFAKKVARKLKRLCGLEERFAGEIRGDMFADTIERLAREENVKTILEIGSSAGGGSTEAFVKGIRRNPNNPTLFCMEVSKERFDLLNARYARDGFVKCYNASSVPLEKFSTEAEVRSFLKLSWNKPARKLETTVLSWLKDELNYLQNSGVPNDGIRKIKRDNGIEWFDMVLIDGSEFTGRAELDEVDGARFILLDDIHALKNHYNWMRLIADPRYVLIAGDPDLRGGFAAFKRS